MQRRNGCPLPVHLLQILILVVIPSPYVISQQNRQRQCPNVPIVECCRETWPNDCPQPQCLAHVLRRCPERKALIAGGVKAGPTKANGNDLRRAPQKPIEEPKCGTAEMNYHPCTSKSVANKLFVACCSLYVPPECHFMCQYETNQTRAKNLLLTMPRSQCSFRHLSAILYCASQNRDNRQCCQDLDLNATQLMVGSLCLRMCDPSGTALTRLTADDVTCLFNWNVMMYCHHSGIREMCLCRSICPFPEISFIISLKLFEQEQRQKQMRKFISDKSSTNNSTL